MPSSITTLKYPLKKHRGAKTISLCPLLIQTYPTHRTTFLHLTSNTTMLTSFLPLFAVLPLLLFLYNPQLDRHFYTISVPERAGLLAPGAGWLLRERDLASMRQAMARLCRAQILAPLPVRADGSQSHCARHQGPEKRSSRNDHCQGRLDAIV